MALVSPFLQLRGISRHYGAVRALDGVDLDISAGEVLGLCGDNGAGKSTLVRILSGAALPSAGSILLEGAPVRFRSPADALARGIATTYQDLALAPRLSIAQNIFMGGEITRGPSWLGLLDKRAMRREAASWLARFNFAVSDMDRPVSDLSGGQRQAVALARALRWKARLIIMDEPTAALGVAEGRAVLELVRALRRDGVAVLLVSHNMDDLVAVTDRVAILKTGRNAAQFETSGVTAGELAQAIITGRAIRPEYAGIQRTGDYAPLT
jgi:ABC-type sugar transport system ATPase subunit